MRMSRMGASAHRYIASSVTVLALVMGILVPGVARAEDKAASDPPAAAVDQTASSVKPADIGALAATAAAAAPSTYTPPPAIPGSLESWNLSPTDGSVNVPLTPVLQQKATGATATVTLEYAFVVCTGFKTGSIDKDGVAKCETGSTMVATSGWIGSPSWQIPAGALAQNTTYGWTSFSRTAGPFSLSIFTDDTSWFATGGAPSSLPDLNDAVVKGISPASQSFSSTLSPTLQAQLKMAKPGGTYFYKYSVRCQSCTGNPEVANSGEIPSASWTVPSGPIYWGGIYAWSISMSVPWQFGGTFPLFSFRPSHTFATSVPVAPNYQVGINSPSPTEAGVVLADRHFEYEATDATVVSPGDPLRVTRRYASVSSAIGAFGYGWSSLLDMKVSPSATGTIVHTGDGQDVAFGRNPNGSFAPAAGSAGTTLASCQSPCSGGDTVFTDQSGFQFVFSNGRLSRVLDPDLFAKNLNYGTDGKVASIVDGTSGRTLTVGWAAGKVSSVTMGSAPAQTPATWTYQYTGNALTGVCPPESTTKCTTYGYSSNLLSSVTRPGGNVSHSVSYDSGGRVAKSTVQGVPTTFSVSASAAGQSVTTTTASAPTVYKLDAWGRPIERSNSVGNYEQWSYLYSGELSWYQKAGAGYVLLAYKDGRLASKSVYRFGLENQTSYAYVSGGAANGKIASVFQGSATSANEVLAYTYDSAGRISTISEGAPGPERTTRKIEYTTGAESACDSSSKVPAGLPTTLTDQAANKTLRLYTARGDLCREQTAAGTSSYGYDTWGRALTVSQSVSSPVPVSQVTLSYGPNGMLAAASSPYITDLVSGKVSQRRVSYSYDANYNQTSIVEADTRSAAKRTTSRQYDANDRLTQETQPDGSTQKFTYDARGSIATQVAPNGALTKFAYDPYGRLTATVAAYTDPTGQSAPRDITLEKREYDAANRVSAVTDTAGHVTKYAYTATDAIQTVKSIAQPLADGSTKDVTLQSYVYDTRGNVRSLTLNDGAAAVAMTYDSKNQLTSSSTTVAAVGDAPASTRVETYSYDPRGLVTQQTVGSSSTPSRTTTTTYDAAGRVSAVTTSATPTSGDKATTWYQRDYRGMVTGVTDPRGTGAGDPAWTTAYQYDVSGKLTQVKSPPAQNGAANAISRFGYDALGRLNASVGPNGQRIDTTMDSMGRVLTQTVPYTVVPTGGIPQSTFEYNSGGLQVRRTEPGGQKTASVYDSLGRAVQQTVSPRVDGASDRVSKVLYNDSGAPVRVIEPSGAKTELTYDALNRVTAVNRTADLGAGVGNAVLSSSRGYDAAGNIAASTDPTGATTRTIFDGFNNPVSVTDPTGGVTKYRYDYLGLVSQTIDPVGNKRVAEHDARGNLTAVSRYAADNALISSSAYSYDTVGNQLSAKDPLGNVEKYSYDAQSRLVSSQTPDGAAISLTYDLTGRISGFTDQRGNTTTATYTPSGQIASQIEPSTASYPNAGDRTTTWSYTSDNLPSTVTLPGGGKIENTYDADGNLTTQRGTSAGKSATNTFAYDDLGNLAGFSTPAGTQTQKYNQVGWLLESEGPAGKSAFGYDKAGRQTTVKDSGGTSLATWSAGGQLQTFKAGNSKAIAYSYDAAGKPTKQTWGDALTRSLSYVDGNLLGTDETKSSSGAILSSTAYTYDDAGNLATKVVSPTTAAGAGTTSYSYDARNRLTSWVDPAKSSHPLTWDKADNLTSAEGVARTYDERNRLTSAGPSSITYDALGNNTTGYSWDPLGNLTNDSVNTYSYDALGRITTAGTTKFSYSGLSDDPSSIGTTSLTRNPRGELVTSGGDLAVTDIRGDLTALGSEGGNVTTRNYNPQGQVVGTKGGGSTPLGMQNDYAADSGIVDMNARWYNPSLGVFLSRDDIALPLNQQNRYAYAGGHWPSMSDPTGHCWGPVAAYCVGGATIGVGEAAIWATALVASIWLGPSAWEGAKQSSNALISGVGNVLQMGSAATGSTTTTVDLSLRGSMAPPLTAASLGTIQQSVFSMRTTIGASMASLSTNMSNLSFSLTRLSQSMAGVKQSMAVLDSSMARFDVSIAEMRTSIASMNASIDKMRNVAPYTGEHPNSFIVENIVPNILGGSGSVRLSCDPANGATSCAAAIASKTICAQSGASLSTACAPALPQLWRGDQSVPALGAVTGAYVASQSASLPPEGPDQEDRSICQPEARGGTYVIRNGEGNVVRSGRTNDFAKREAAHRRSLPDDYTFEAVTKATDRATVRGLEQLLYDEFPLAKAQFGGLNKIRAVAEKNPRLDEYLGAAQQYLEVCGRSGEGR